MKHFGHERYELCRTLPDGSLICVVPLLMGNARLMTTRAEDAASGLFADGSWDYDRMVDAVYVCNTWDGKGAPPGYYRNNAELEGKRFPGRRIASADDA